MAIETKRKRVIKALESAKLSPEATRILSDEDLLKTKGIGPKALKDIRRFWPVEGNGTDPAAVPVYQFGLKGNAEKSKRGGIWFDMGKIAPELWGPLHIRYRSLTSPAVTVAVDQAETEVLATAPGKEVLLAKVREEVNGDTGDRALANAVIAASFMIMNKPTRRQQLEIEWRRLLAGVRGIRGTAVFGSDPNEVTTLTGKEPAEEVQALISDVIETSTAHQRSLTRLAVAITQLEDSEIVSLGEDYVVTELPSANSPASGATSRSSGKE